MVCVYRWPLVAVLVSGCFVDIGSASVTTTASDTTSATASDPTNPSDPATTALTTTEPPPASTSDPETTGLTCQPAGAACSSNDTPCCGCLTCEDGACVQGTCDTCHRCADDGSCVPDEPGTACTGPEDLCPTLAFGFADGTCHAYAAASPICDDTATCVPGPCTTKGAAHITCPECQLAMPNCFAGLPLRGITLADVCQTTGTTDQCKPSCTSASQLVTRGCDINGQCGELGAISCIPYACDPDSSACKTECDSDIDCTIQYTCNFFGECN